MDLIITVVSLLVPFCTLAMIIRTPDKTVEQKQPPLISLEGGGSINIEELRQRKDTFVAASR
jgi:hypothetical protein